MPQGGVGQGLLQHIPGRVMALSDNNEPVMRYLYQKADLVALKFHWTISTLLVCLVRLE